MEQSIQAHLRRMQNFMGFARGFLIRKNPLKTFAQDCVAVIKEIFSIRQKQKIANYRLGYQIRKLNQMEELIATNNDHTFLKGKKFNEMR